TTNEGSMSNIKEMRASSGSALEIGSEIARAFLARFEHTVRTKAAGELQRIEEAEEDDEEWALQKARAKLAQKRQGPERKLLELARDAAVAAERLATCENDLGKISTDTARNARKDIVEAIEHLQAFEKFLADKIS